MMSEAAAAIYNNMLYGQCKHLIEQSTKQSTEQKKSSNSYDPVSSEYWPCASTMTLSWLNTID
jgi:hypothetical protein